MTTYAIFRIIGSKPGCVDFLGSYPFATLADAERYADETFDHDADDWFDIQPEDV